LQLDAPTPTDNTITKVLGRDENNNIVEREVSTIGGTTAAAPIDNRLVAFDGTAGALVAAPIENTGTLLRQTQSTAFEIATGTTAERPLATTAGRLRWNETNNNLEVSDGTNYVDISTESIGEMYIASTETLTFSGGSVAPQKPVCTAGILSNCTYSSGRITYTGTDTENFKITVSSSFSFAENTTEISGYVAVNGTEQTKIGFTRTIGTSGSLGSAALTGILSLSTNDYVEVFFYPSSHTGDDDLIIENLNLNVVKI
jgi:hypothetical protein